MPGPAVRRRARFGYGHVILTNRSSQSKAVGARKRRAAPVLLAAVLVGMLVLGAPASSAQESPPAAAESQVPGNASAIAELIKLNPAIGNLSLAIRMGTSLAGHQNNAANSEVRSIDLGFIGKLLSDEGCDGSAPVIPPGTFPDATLASSSDPEAADGITGGIDGVIETLARADASASSTARADLAPLGIPGIASITGGHSRAVTSSDGHVASAVTEIGRLELAGGLVAIEGLRWEATHRLLPERSSTSSFEIGSLRIAGMVIPLPAGDLVDELTKVLEPVLDPLGIKLTMPRVIELEDGIDITPVSVGLVPGEVRDSLLAPIFGGTRDPYTQLTEFLISLDCTNATYVTVLDLVLGAVSGGGFTTLDLGGVTTRASEFEMTSFLGGTGSAMPGDQLSALPSESSASDRTAPASPDTSSLTTGAPSSTQVSPADAGGDPGDGSDADEQAIGFTPPGGERGGPLLLVGAAGLLAALGAGIGERRRMRTAQRRRPM